MFNDFKLVDGRPASVQVKDYIKELIYKGILRADQKLPSTREFASLWQLSRNTVMTAYRELEDEGLIHSVAGKGSYVAQEVVPAVDGARLEWKDMIGACARTAEELDLMKHGVRWEKGMISFTSIAPDEKLFDLDNVKRAFLDRMSLEGEILLNYGYAKGYKPLIDYLMRYMETKGVDLTGKDLLVTNGFTEGLDLVLSAVHKPHRRVLCENPTHHTALKLFKMHGMEITGIPMQEDGLELEDLERALIRQSFDLAYLIPSYHNPTGIVMSPEKRMEALRLFGDYRIPVIEDGFNEELRYSGSHVAPLIACGGSGNNVVYIGSYSKVLFPGIRVGWVLADRELIDYLESMKRARSIHTSTLDQAILFQYLHNGNFEKYIKRARNAYKRKYELAVQWCREHIPFARLSGYGGLHLFIELHESLAARDVLSACVRQGVVFTPGDIFHTDGSGTNTFRLGFSRVSEGELEAGIATIGQMVRQLMGEGTGCRR
ncbi:PLP-dependent aminotransferase family protein [Paenibacillus thiaminolyticus]|uniref:PLP-dependent aminotransferase family protein n=1 Tax=Paenibacillus thiaminolyticus TaxID=49283 RepID=A0A3A3H9S1_PANTH|nr:PLP-dependent aminotransferase family protein [Paenibacillus thiaminolyticus]RJG26987.1 PLP-dependent aminotransferase family protein [Paenibacillus thiaminolyticus]